MAFVAYFAIKVALYDRNHRNPKPPATLDLQIEFQATSGISIFPCLPPQRNFIKNRQRHSLYWIKDTEA